RADCRPGGWAAAIQRGAVKVEGEAWTTRPLSEREGLWMLISGGDLGVERRHLLSWLVGSWAATALVTVGLGLMSSRAHAREKPHSRMRQERARNREAFQAITRAVDSAKDLSA